MSYVFHRSARTVPPLATKAFGNYIFDNSGRRYLDASGGAAVTCIGHGDPRVLAAASQQIAQLDYVHSGAFTSQPAEDLAELICETAGQGMSRVYFVSSGSEAVETALKMARQVQIERGHSSRHIVISRQQSYHGNTLGALARSGSETRRTPFLPMLPERAQIMPCFHFRYANPGETPEEFGRRAADALETEILRLGPENVSAFLAETVVGATSGAVAPAPGYFKRIREICDLYGVLLICDEVMCGAFRTGPFLACAEEGVSPDIVTLAKGLGGGYLPIGAVACRAEIHDSFAEGSGGFTNGHTYMAHPTSCAAALAVQKVIVEDGLAERVTVQGEALDAALRARLAQHPHVGDIRGRGLLRAIEIVADRDSLEPFGAGLGVSSRIGAKAKALGLLVYPGAGTIDGQRGDHILLAPAYSIESAEIEQIADLLTAAVDAAIPR